MKDNPAIRKALVETGLPFTIENGTRHRKVRVCGRLAAVIPMRGTGSEADRRATMNTIAQIRRLARTMKEQTA